MELKVEILDTLHYQEWNNFVKVSPQGSVFNLSWYLDCLNLDFKVLIVSDNSSKIFAGIVIVKNEIRTFSNPIFVKHLGILFKNDSLRHKDNALRYKLSTLLIVELKKYKTFDYFFHPKFLNWIPFYWNGFAQETRYTYQTDLTKSSDLIYSSFHEKLRNDIKNAVNNDIKVVTNPNINLFYSTINKTFLRQGSKAPFSKEKLINFIKKMNVHSSFMSFAAVDNDDNIIAVCGYVFSQNTSYLILNGIDIDKNTRGANALMIFESMKLLKEKGITIFDFEGSMLPGVEQFYRRFGAELVPYMRIWNDNFINYSKSKLKRIYKKFRYGR